MFNVNVITIKKNINLQCKMKVSLFFKIHLPKLINFCLAVIINNEIQDFNYIINNNLNLNTILINDNQSLHIIKQSCAFLCGYALKKIWPEKKEINISITNDGFNYDFDMHYRIKKNDLKLINKEMLRLLSLNFLNIKSSYVNEREFIKICNKNYEYYILRQYSNVFKKQKLLKIFHIKDYFSIYPFFVNNINYNYTYFKLINISGIYLNNTNKMIQRIQCIVCNNLINLQKYFINFNKIKKIDHRKISHNLKLYHIDQNNPGLVFWHEKGLIIFNELKKIIKEKLINLNYKEVKTPLMLLENFWKKTGHLTFYKDYIYTIKNKNNNFCLKPMNCPAHAQIFNQDVKSYKDLPYKLSEFGQCFRNESSGSLHGLMRLKNFTQDDAHIFCTIDQLQTVINECINLIYEIYTIFCFKKIWIKLSTRPINRFGNETDWDKAELILSDILIKKKIKFNYQLNSGAFYGPKIEFILTDSLNREWQCGTLQVDFFLSKRLNICYIDKQNKKTHPIIVHRALLGSLERFIGIILEEYNGLLPIFLSPIQVAVINITNNQAKYAKKIYNIFLKLKIRTILDIRPEPLSFKIREHFQNKINFVIICGEKEKQTEKISFNTIKKMNIKLISINNFIYYLLRNINNF